MAKAARPRTASEVRSKTGSKTSARKSATRGPRTRGSTSSAKDSKADRRAQILDGLFDAMAARGMVGTSVTEIAQAAGIARGALHYYFESKDAIRHALMERLGAGYLDGLRASLERAAARVASGASDHEAPIRALVRYHFGHDRDRTARLLGVWIDFWGQAPADPGLARIVFDVQDGARAVCADLLRRMHGMPAGAPLAPHAPAAVLSIIEGALLQWRIARASGSPAVPADGLSIALVHTLRHAIAGFAPVHTFDDATTPAAVPTAEAPASAVLTEASTARFAHV